MLQRDDADTVIVNEEAREAYAQYYQMHKTIHIESPGFISRCIKLGRYHHEPPRRSGMGGREPRLKLVLAAYVVVRDCSCVPPAGEHDSLKKTSCICVDG